MNTKKIKKRISAVSIIFIIITMFFLEGFIQPQWVFADEKDLSENVKTEEPVLKEELDIDEPVEPLMLYRAPQSGKSLKITKVDKEDHSIKLAGAEFLLKGKINSSYSKTMKTNNNGELIFEDIPDGYYSLTETKNPEGYQGTIEKTVYVSDEGIMVYDADSKKPKVIRKRSKTFPIVSVKETMQLTCQKNSYRGAIPRLDISFADAMSWHLEMTLSDDVKAGDTFCIRFDEKISPGSLTEPYKGPEIYFKDDRSGKPAAIPSYDREKNIITYTFTDRVNGSVGSKININFDSIGVRNWNPTLRPNEMNYFTNSIEGVKGGNAVFSRNIFVDYASDDNSLKSICSENNWATGTFSDVDRRDTVDYVDFVYYVNIKPGNKPNGIGRWNYNQRKVSFATSKALYNRPVDMHVYRIPDKEKNRLMIRSFPNPSNSDFDNSSYTAQLRDKEITRQCSMDLDRVLMTDSNNPDLAYTVQLPFPEAPHHADGFIIHLRYRIKDNQDEASVYSRWHELGTAHGSILGKCYQSAGGKRGPTFKSLLIENEKIKEKIKLTIRKSDKKNIPLKGAEFQLRKSGKIISSGTTDKNGILDFKDIEYGEYSLIETKAPPGYMKLEEPELIKIEKTNDLSVGDDKKFKKIDVTSHYSEENKDIFIEYRCNVTNYENHIDFVKTDEKGNPVKAIGTFILKKDGKEYGKDLHNDSEGKISLSKLPEGKYMLYEKKAPFGYELPKSHVAEFTVDEDGHILNIKSLNRNGKLEEGTEIVNKKRQLPNTVGETPLYIVSSGLAIAIAGLIGIKKRKCDIKVKDKFVRY